MVLAQQKFAFNKTNEEGLMRENLCNCVVLNQLEGLERCVVMEGCMMNVLLAL